MARVIDAQRSGVGVVRALAFVAAVAALACGRSKEPPAGIGKLVFAGPVRALSASADGAFLAFLDGCLATLFSAAYPAYVPSLIGVDRVVEGNSKLATSSSIAEVGGPGLAGALVQIVSAPFAILIDALSFLVSAVSLLLIRTPEPSRPPRETTSRIVPEIVEGLRTVRGHPIVFPLALRSIIGHIAGAFYGVLYAIYLLEELHLDAFLLGIVIASVAFVAPAG